MRAVFMLLAAFLPCALGQAALADRWSFEEVILDQDPLADKRINDLAIGDLNGDGRPDIWVSGRNGDDHQAAWYANPGPPFTNWTRQTFLPGSWKYGDVGDLDGDGDLDIVAGFDDEKKVYWVENDGMPEDGGWTKHFMGITGKPDQILAHDLDGDERIEVIAIYKKGPVRILSRPADPRAAWPSFDFGKVSTKVSGASVGDVDNDGDPDVVFGNQWFENPLPDETWKEPDRRQGRIIDPDWVRETRSAVADIDRDGRNDIVLTSEESDEGIVWYRSDDPQSSTPWQPTAVNNTPYNKLHGVAVGDINGDTRPDILVAEMHTSKEKRVTVFAQGDDPNEWIEHVVADVGSHNAKLADLNGDGRLDLTKGDVDSLKLADINGDDRPDAVIGTEDAKWLVWAEHPGGDGSGTWPEHLIAEDFKHLSLDVADLDQDGDLDVVSGDHGSAAEVAIYENLDNGRAWTRHVVDPGEAFSKYRLVRWARRFTGLDTPIDHHAGTQLNDLDNDGDLDIVSIGWHHKTLVLYENLALP